MSQPAWTIDEPIINQAQGAPGVDSLQPPTVSGASPIDRPAQTINGILIQDGTDAGRIDDPIPIAPHADHQSSLPFAPAAPRAIADVAAPSIAPGVGGCSVHSPAPPVAPAEGDAPNAEMRCGVSQLPSISPSTPPQIAEFILPLMPAGVGGFNIALPAPRTSPVEGDVAMGGMRVRRLLEPLAVPPPIELDRQATIVRPGRSSFVFGLLAAIAIAGAMLLAFPDEAGKQGGAIPGGTIPGTITHDGIPGTITHDGESKPGKLAPPTHLAVENQKGFANEPLPLGVSLKDAAGGETVTIAGLTEGIELSLGTSLGPAGWQVSAHELDQTFVGSPKDFVGAVGATVQLRSATGQLLESQVIRLEWTEKKEPGLKKEDRLMPVLGSPEPTPVVAPRDPEPIAANPKPLAADPKQIAADPKPIAADPKPLAADPKQIVADPKQIAADPKQILADPKPIATNPKQIAVDPERIAADPAQIAALIGLAEDLLKHGDVATAQVLLKRAAMAGSAQAALELGMTFDQAFLSQWGVLGFTPDAAQAREWYDRAVKLGSPEASRHLEQSANMPK